MKTLPLSRQVILMVRWRPTTATRCWPCFRIWRWLSCLQPATMAKIPNRLIIHCSKIIFFPL